MKYVNGGGAVACSPETYEVVKSYAEKESISMKNAMDTIILEWYANKISKESTCEELGR